MNTDTTIEIQEGYAYLTDITELIKEYTASLNRDLSFQGLQDELHDLKVKYAYPNGRLLAAVSADGVVAGCIAYHKLSDQRCEMKRLYVKQEYRKQHIGSKLIEALISQAVKDGYQEMVLDTIEPLQDAIRLYHAFGF